MNAIRYRQPRIPLRSQGGVAALTGRLGTNREAHLIRFLFEVINRPVCTAEERAHLLVAHPPRLGKAGNAPRADSRPFSKQKRIT